MTKNSRDYIKKHTILWDDTKKTVEKLINHLTQHTKYDIMFTNNTPV